MSNPFSADASYFYDLGPETVLTAVERLGVRATGKVMALNSLENRVYQVEIEVDEQDITSPFDRYRIAKFYRPGRWSKDQILEEHTFLDALHEQGVPVVPQLRFDDGNTLQQDDNTGLYFCVSNKVGGRHTTELADSQQKIIGRTLARIHNIGTSFPDTNRPTLTPESFGSENVEYLLSSPHLPEASKQAYQSVVSPILQHAKGLFQNVSLHRIHGDCHLGNVLWIDETLQVLDFDDMVFGPAVQDIWLINPGRDDDSKKRQEALIEGYQELRAFNPSELSMIEALRALRIIHFEAWIGRRWEDPAFQRTFPQYGSAGYWREELAALTEITELLSRV